MAGGRFNSDTEAGYAQIQVFCERPPKCHSDHGPQAHSQSPSEHQRETEFSPQERLNVGLSGLNVTPSQFWEKILKVK